MAITLLSAPPPSLTQEELLNISSSTPQTFEGIPPLLRHHEQDGLRIKVEPDVQGFDGEGFDGALWVTEGALSFFSSASSTGLSIPYSHITLHAISRPSPPAEGSASTNGSNGVAQEASIYLQFEEVEGAEEGDDYDGSGSHELWITPKDSSSIDKIFQTLSYCSSLHPTSSSTAPGVTNGATGESLSHFNDPSASLFASMGLDPDSMVFAGPDGQLAGPGLAAMLAEEEGTEQYDDGVEEEQQESEGGRTRSDFVNPGRARGAPY